MNHVQYPNVPDILSVFSGGVNPFSEARERASKKTGIQPATISGVTIDVTISIEAIANNWNRVVKRLESEIDKPYPNQTYYLQNIYMPNPAYDGWTIVLQFCSVEEMNAKLEFFRNKIERIVNDKRK